MPIQKIKNIGTSLLRLIHNSYRIGKITWKEQKLLMVGIVIIMTISSAAPFLRSGSLGYLVNTLNEVAGSHTLNSSVLLVLLLFAGASMVVPLAYSFQEYLSWLMWFIIEKTFELFLLKKLGSLDLAQREDPAHNDLFNRVQEGLWRVRAFLDRQFYMYQNVIEVIIASIILGFANWWILLIVIAGTVPELVVEMKYGKTIWGIHEAESETRRKFWELRSHFLNVSYVTELKLFRNVKHFLRMIEQIFSSFHEKQRKEEKSRLHQELSVFLVSQTTIICAIAWFVYQVIEGNLLVGTLVFIISSISDFRQSLSSFFVNFGKQYQDNLFIDDFFTLLRMKPFIEERSTTHTLPPSKTPLIEFDSVSFAYPNSDIFSLRDISLTIEPGKKIALVGANGAGKTTFVKLLCGFYSPTKGEIRLDGIPLQDISLDSYYSKLGVLFQEYAHYTFPVKELISLGDTSVPISEEQVRAASRMSESEEFILSWKNGYDQMIGKQFKGGVEPSIGQWQKLALARIFYRDPHIYILDEPTSSIDSESEARIFEKMENLPPDKTVFLISHRFSTVRHADTILVFKDHHIAEQGTHAELLRQDGIYAHMFQTQAKGYTE